MRKVETCHHQILTKFPLITIFLRVMYTMCCIFKTKIVTKNIFHSHACIKSLHRIGLQTCSVFPIECGIMNLKQKEVYICDYNVTDQLQNESTALHDERLKTEVMITSS